MEHPSVLQRGQRLGERGELPNFGSSDQMASDAVPSDVLCLWFLNRDLRQGESIANSEICKMKRTDSTPHTLEDACSLVSHLYTLCTQ